MIFTTLSPAALLAHNGGWDEILLVVGPIALFGGLLWLANKRAKDRLAGQIEAAGPVESAD
ncbi:MAG: hypothetical protein GY745_06690 [Actinomycetia bacterium]|nr:hypothetical protein [Actinomycetes bacterium]MCP3910651.1 hypothetical protein [Actinomycetes bacterium]MCP4084722.1 hypothetical protein [Actinomycetes bacterium]